MSGSNTKLVTDNPAHAWRLMDSKQSIDCVPGVSLSVLRLLTHLIFTTLQQEYYYHCHFTDKEMGLRKVK